MKISVALATFNGEKFIRKQLSSLINQTLNVNEVIITDDNSSDNTVAIIHNFIKNYENKIDFSFKINNKNQGYIKNFYNTLKRATGDIIFLCDQDDIWEPDKVESICNLFKTNKKVSAVSTAYDFIDKDDNKIIIPNFSGVQHMDIEKKLKRRTYVKVSEIETIKANPSPGCTSAISSYIRDYYIKNASLIIPHDWEINIYSAKMGGLYFYNKKLVLYRIHDSNTIGIKYYSPQIKKFFHFNYGEDDKENFKKILENLYLFFSKYHKNTTDKKVINYINKIIKYPKY